MTDVIAEIRAAVRKKFRTDRAFAEAVGVTPQAVRNWWARGSVSHEQRARVAELTGVPYKRLVPNAPPDAAVAKANEVREHISQVRDEVEALYAATPINVERLAEAIALVQRICTKKGVRPPIKKRALVIARVYADGLKSGAERIVQDWLSRETLNK